MKRNFIIAMPTFLRVFWQGLCSMRVGIFTCFISVLLLRLKVKTAVGDSYE